MKKYDMTQGPLFSKIFLFALPIAITGILQQLFNSVDVAVIGQFVGKEAMAGVGTDAPIVGIIISLLSGLSLGTTVTVAQAIGRRSRKDINRAVHTSILLALIAGLIMMVIFEAIVPSLLTMMNVPGSVYDYALKYLRIYSGGLVIFALYDFTAAILRAAGHTKEPMYALIISGIINVILNLLFVIVFHLDVVGVALATVIANGVSVMLLMRKLITIDEDIRVHRSDLKIHPTQLSAILHVGAPAGMQGMLFDISNMIVQWGINSLGTIAMAGSSAAFNIEIFIFYVLIAFAQACTTFVGQNYGAAHLDRCQKTLAISLFQGMSITGIFCIGLLVFSQPLLHLFTQDDAVVKIGQIQLFYMAVMYVFSALQEIASGYLRGYGVSIIPTLISVMGICGLRVVWIMTIFKSMPTFQNLMMLYPISQGVTGIIILLAGFLFTRHLLHKQAYD